MAAGYYIYAPADSLSHLPSSAASVGALLRLLPEQSSRTRNTGRPTLAGSGAEACAQDPGAEPVQVLPGLRERTHPGLCVREGDCVLLLLLPLILLN